MNDPNVPSPATLRLIPCTTLVLVQSTGALSPLKMLPELMSSLAEVAAQVKSPQAGGALVPVIIDQRSSGEHPPLLRATYDVARGDLRWDSIIVCRREMVPAEAAGLLGLPGHDLLDCREA